jgi:glycerophosphoryl diester phosphodiesterase
VERVVAAVPGLHAGFDPLAFYPRSFALDAAGFRAVATRMLATAPAASIYYLEAKLVLAALEHGVDLVAEVSGAGAQVDAWTIDADHPQLSAVLRRLIDAGCRQITSNDPERLTRVIEEITQHNG